MNDFGELSVNIKGTNTYGSGILYQYDDENGYVITAKHCVYNTDTQSMYLNLEFIDYNKDVLEVAGIPNYSKDSDLDLATIKVKIKKKYPSLLIMEPKNNQNIVLFGYPEHMKENNDGTPIRGRTTQIDKPNIFKIVMDNELFSSYNTEYDNTRGYSGSGVYVEDGERCYLIGMVTTLESDGKHGIIKGIHIDKISSFFEKEHGITLLPSCLVDFSEHLNTIISSIEKIDGQTNKLVYLIQECYEKQFADITPKIIHGYLNEYLIHPYQKTFDYTNRLLWIGWLEILLCKSLQSNFDFDIKDFFKFLTQDKTRSGIHILFTNSATIDHFIGGLFRSNLYDKIDDSDILFVNNPERRFFGNSIAKKNQIEGIVRNIDHPQVTKRLCIDDPDEQKLFPIVHVEYIEDEIVRFLMETKVLTAMEFSKEFPNKLNEIFEEIEK